MLQLDALSAYAVCGAGTLVGAALLRPSLAYDESSGEVLRTSRWAFALSGVGTTQIVLHAQPVPAWSLALLSYAVIGGVTMLAWAMAALSGRALSRLPLWPLLAGTLFAQLALMPMGLRGVSWFAAWGLAASTLLLMAFSWRFVLRPRDQEEWLLGCVTVLAAGTSCLRVAFLFTWDGPYESHLLHMPHALVLPYALMYGVLPISFAMLLLNVLNTRLQARLRQRAMTDPLTGALSRLALTEGAESIIATLPRTGRHLAVVMVDLDHFKGVNDRYGHPAGDAVLRHAAHLLQAQLRGDALLARFGGEEFVVLFPVEDLHGARRTSERLRAALVDAHWADLVPGLTGQTASIGVTLLAPDESLERAIARADEALYRAKQGGRNLVQVGIKVT